MSRWNCFDVSGRGKAHIERGLPCQDKTWSEEYGGVTAAALADGAGYALYSDAGAETAVHTICRYFTRNFGTIIESSAQDAADGILGTVREAIAHRAAEMNSDPSQLACTLLAVAVRGQTALLVHIGDGVIGYTDAGTGRVGVLSSPCNGKYINTTAFVTSPNAAEKISLYRCSTEKIGSFILMSDGCAESLYSRRSVKLDQTLELASLAASVKKPENGSDFLENYLTSCIFPCTDDDCSLVIAAQRMTPERCLGMELRKALYGSDDRRVCENTDRVLRLCMEKPRTAREIRRLTHVRSHPVSRRLLRLTSCGLLQLRHGTYHADSSA